MSDRPLLSEQIARMKGAAGKWLPLASMPRRIAVRLAYHAGWLWFAKPELVERYLELASKPRSLIGEDVEWPGSSPDLSMMVKRALKRAIDIAVASFMLFLFSPLLFFIALLIRISSPGPVLFRQLRLGLHGQPYYILKFRTMIPDAELRLGELEALNESDGGVLFKMRHDPRVTRLGRILRRASIDELPQLINVLCGEMSLIGPRPLQFRDSIRLEALDPVAFHLRLTVKPGISGPWQAGGYYDRPTEMISQDLHYIRNWSLARDMRILLRTIPAVLTGRGAY